jgi:hypothetical protein
VEHDQCVVASSKFQAVAGGGEQDAGGQAESALSTGKMDPNSLGWTKKVRIVSHGMN